MKAARSGATPLYGDFADDPPLDKVSIRVDERKRRPMDPPATKTLAESTGDWDCFKLVATIKPEDAWRPLEKAGRSFVKA
jgi:branched-chain amino acid transport system substrate-binding protein